MCKLLEEKNYSKRSETRLDLCIAPDGYVMEFVDNIFGPMDWNERQRKYCNSAVGDSIVGKYVSLDDSHRMRAE